VTRPSAELAYERRLWRSSAFTASAGIRSASFQGWAAHAPTMESAIASHALPAPAGLVGPARSTPAARAKKERAIVRPTSSRRRGPARAWKDTPSTRSSVFGPGYGGFATRLLRGSFSAGLQTTAARDVAFQILLGAGTRTIDDGFELEQVRFVVGTGTSF
jgi:hypothetical protein